MSEEEKVTLAGLEQRIDQAMAICEGEEAMVFLNDMLVSLALQLC